MKGHLLRLRNDGSSKHNSRNEHDEKKNMLSHVGKEQRKTTITSGIKVVDELSRACYI